MLLRLNHAHDVYQFTTTLATLCRLPEGSKESNALNDQVITLLYNTLPHPPATYVGTDYPAGAQSPAAPSVPSTESVSAPGPRLPGTYRTADGGGNNVNMPNMGKARTPYARSVQNKYPLSPNSLPDTGVVFDALIKARDVGHSAHNFLSTDNPTHGSSNRTREGILI